MKLSSGYVSLDRSYVSNVIKRSRATNNGDDELRASLFHSGRDLPANFKIKVDSRYLSYWSKSLYLWARTDDVATTGAGCSCSLFCFYPEHGNKLVMARCGRFIQDFWKARSSFVQRLFVYYVLVGYNS